MKRGKLRFSKGKIKAAAVEQFPRIFKQRGMITAKTLPLGRGAKMKFSPFQFSGMFLLQKRAGSDRLDHIELPAVGGRCIMNRTRQKRRDSPGQFRHFAQGLNRPVESAWKNFQQTGVAPHRYQSFGKILKLVDADG